MDNNQTSITDLHNHLPFHVSRGPGIPEDGVIVKLVIRVQVSCDL